jgi:DNA polymerase-3 subunit delta'
MNESWHTIGHEPAKQLLDRALTGRRLAHAYLFVGPDGVGKRTLALEFFAKLLGAADPEKHPDFLSVDGAVVEADELRELLGRLAHKPVYGKDLCVLIDNLQALSVTSANTLLKTIEEPRDHVKLILVSNSRSVLATILSRCIAIHFSELDEEQMFCFIERNTLRLPTLGGFTTLGSPGLLSKTLSDESVLEVLTEHVSDVDVLLEGTLHDKMVLLQKLAEYDTAVLDTLLQQWTRQLRNRITTEPKLFKNIGDMLSARENLSRSFNKKLVLQRLLVR